MAKYSITKEAREDLRSIWNYTFDKWSENQAVIYYNCLIAEFEDIATSKDNFDKEYANIREGLYCRRCRKHLIFYDKTNGKTIIVRVLHERMDIESKF